MLGGKKILAMRKKFGYTQEDLAENLSVSHQAVSRWESGQAVPDAEKLVQLGRLLGVSTDYLLDDEQPVALEERPEREDVSQRKNRADRASTALLAVGLAVVLVLVLLSRFLPSTTMTRQDVTDSSQTRTEALGENAAEGTESAAMRYVYTPEETYSLFSFLSSRRLWPVFCLGCLALCGGAWEKVKRKTGSP